MTNFNYSWKVVDANDQTKIMLVEYSLEGYKTQLVAMPLPTEVISLELRTQQYAPTALWEFEMINHVSVEVGATGSNSFTVREPFSNNVAIPGSNGEPGSPSATPA
jgi:hypothetical protein